MAKHPTGPPPIHTPQQIAAEDPGTLRDIILSAVTPLHERLIEAENLLAIVCHEHADLIEIGRQEERGILIRELVDIRKRQTYPPSPDATGIWVAIDLIQKRGSSLPSPLPPTKAAERIAQLEQALVDIINFTQFAGSQVMLDISKKAVEALDRP